MPRPSPTELAQYAYAAYGASTHFRTHDDRQMPEWEDLGDRVQQAWTAAAAAVATAVIEQPAENAVRSEQPAPQRPSIGRIVHYTLSEWDAGQINRRRKDFHENGRAQAGSGFVGHIGNWAAEGDVFPAVVVKVFNESTVTANLQVLLDGNDTYWATSAAEGDRPGTWAWPGRV
ncbi:hypothetical protein [Streptomyces europaeiscabiei]|uniref:Uncharacterized protein n=1 Tax=Streptomyces europaeiscabiei TaxID=146819 RepID=A0ABU4NR22_9ACTN|nr:hypothetical protein [Streptomyces europaeiscabiei]MDX3555175.1 hypothetical protein [Streptomyces europaeiscabiei]MDX3705189.1 hypothetical protein [Streptomyces europaeiscabiei]MDX3864400.1 hypothetical protein [Streptomyces europaeiscabiei]MDX3871518.1 hypothetical protein [Streptomyces europaeiscabiei]